MELRRGEQIACKGRAGQGKAARADKAPRTATGATRVQVKVLNTCQGAGGSPVFMRWMPGLRSGVTIRGHTSVGHYSTSQASAQKRGAPKHTVQKGTGNIAGSTSTQVYGHGSARAPVHEAEVARGQFSEIRYKLRRIILEHLCDMAIIFAENIYLALLPHLRPVAVGPEW